METETNILEPIYIGANGNWYVYGQDTGVRAQGPDGKSAYEVAVENGFVGTQLEWLLSLKGEKGDKGDKGDVGPQGPASVEPAVTDLQLTLNTSAYKNTTYAYRCGKKVCVFPYVMGNPAGSTLLASGLPVPRKEILLYAYPFGIVQLNRNGELRVISNGTTAASYFSMPFTYYTEE